ncbi:MAG: 1-aminocyclopropane-1-carboxylate deaminase/D-cysteine desulfhydrase [Promethearchaeota archaeon]
MKENPLNVENTSRPLFHAFPGLLGKIPWVPLMDGVPTPVHELSSISANYPSHDVWIKRDDLTSSIYGGNKPRKFEFLLGSALKQGKKTIVTAGGIGTNHGLATALFCKALGLKSHLFMFEQPLTWNIQQKLLMYIPLGTRLTKVRNYGGLVFRGLGTFLFKPRTFIMLPGGSPLFGIGSPAGSLGFVNAAFELKEQVEREKMPEPDHIVIACGSTGSSAGLVLGCKLAGLKTKVIPVKVSESIVANPGVIEKNAMKILKLMKKADPSVPGVTIKRGDDFIFADGFLGSKYGAVTPEALAAVDLVHEKEKKAGFHLETTYTGKACAAMFKFMREDIPDGHKTMLFWNTYNSVDLDYLLEGTTNTSYTSLPKPFHGYFKEKFTCWEISGCPEEVRETCKAYLNNENRCWKVLSEIQGQEKDKCATCETREKIEGTLYSGCSGC